MKIYTSYYANPDLAKRDDLLKVAISLYLPRWKLPYKIDERIKELAPKKFMLNIKNEWQYRGDYYALLRERLLTGDGLLSFPDGNSFYEISKRHKDKDLVLLCFENIYVDENWCHRRMFADWWEIQTGDIINEIYSSYLPER